MLGQRTESKQLMVEHSTNSTRHQNISRLLRKQAKTKYLDDSKFPFKQVHDLKLRKVNLEEITR